MPEDPIQTLDELIREGYRIEAEAASLSPEDRADFEKRCEEGNPDLEFIGKIRQCRLDGSMSVEEAERLQAIKGRQMEQGYRAELLRLREQGEG